MSVGTQRRAVNRHVRGAAAVVASIIGSATAATLIALPVAASPLGDAAYGPDFVPAQAVGAGGIADNGSAALAARVPNGLLFTEAQRQGASLKFTLAFQNSMATPADQTYTVGVRLTPPTKPALDLRAPIGPKPGVVERSLDGGKTWTTQEGATGSTYQVDNRQPTVTIDPAKLPDPVYAAPSTNVQGSWSLLKSDGSGFVNLSNAYPLGSLTGDAAPNTIALPTLGSEFGARGLSSTTCSGDELPAVHFDPVNNTAMLAFPRVVPQQATINIGGARDYETLTAWTVVNFGLSGGLPTGVTGQDHSVFPAKPVALAQGDAVSVTGATVTVKLTDAKASPLLPAGSALTANIGFPRTPGIECLYQAALVPLSTLSKQRVAAIAQPGSTASPVGVSTAAGASSGSSGLGVGLGIGGGVLALSAVAGGLVLWGRRPSDRRQDEIDRMGVEDLKARIEYLRDQVGDRLYPVIDDAVDRALLSDGRSDDDLNDELSRARARLFDLEHGGFDPTPPPAPGSAETDETDRQPLG